MNETEQVLDERVIWQKFLDEIVTANGISNTLAETLLCVIFVISIIGNSLTTTVIYFDRSMHTVTNYYIFNLAVSDLIVTLSIIVEFYYRYYIWNEYNAFTSLMCKVQYFIVGLLWNNSILTVTALAVERYLAIWYPMLVSSKPAWKRILKIVLLLWIIAALEILLEVQTADLIVTNDINICFIIPTASARTVNVILAVLTFIVPAAVIVIVYCMVMVKVNENRNLIRNKAFNYPHSNRNKVNKLIVAITLSFFMCWIPFCITRVLIFVLDIKQLTNLKNYWIILYNSTTVNGWIGTAINPILFSLLSTKFREALKRMWLRRLRKKGKVCTNYYNRGDERIFTKL